MGHGPARLLELQPLELPSLQSSAWAHPTPSCCKHTQNSSESSLNCTLHGKPQYFSPCPPVPLQSFVSAGFPCSPSFLEHPHCPKLSIAAP